MTTPLYIDNSTLKATAQCSTQDLMRYVLGYTTPDEKAYLLRGTAFHEGAAELFRTGDLDHAFDVFANGRQCPSCLGETNINGDPCILCKATGKIAQGYQEWAEANVEPDDKKGYSWDNSARVMRYWLETHPLPALAYKVDPELVEIGFAEPLTEPDECACGHTIANHALPIDGDTHCTLPPCACPAFQPIVFCGRLDAIGTLDGGLYVVEHKTTGGISTTWLDQWWLDSQLSGYVWAGQRAIAQPVVGVILNGVEFKKLPGSDRKCKDHGVPYAECGHLHAKFQTIIIGRSPEELAEWRMTALHLARKHRDLLLRFGRLEAVPRVRTQGKFNGACPHCANNLWCRGGRRLNEVATNFIIEPWEPFDRASMARLSTARKP